MVMLVTFIALFLTCMMFITYDVITVRQNMVNELSLVSDIIGKRTAPALEYSVDTKALENLADLKSKPSVRLACLYVASEKKLAEFHQGQEMFSCPDHPSKGYQFEGKYLTLSQDVFTTTGTHVGSIYILADLREISEHLVKFGFGVTYVIITVMLIAYFITLSVQKAISNPILTLTNTAKAVRKEGHYAVRAQRFYNDEIGILADSFNDMLGEVQKRDSELKEANETLEDQVKKRTEKIVESNIALKKSNQEKEVAKQALEKSHSTLEKVNKDLEHAITLKDLWIANIGHEIRTPIHQIISMLQFAFSDFESGKTDAITTLRYLKNGIKSSERLKKLIECLLDFEKLRSGKEKLNFQEADMYQEIRDLADVLEPSIAKKNIKLQIHEPTCNTVFRFDKDKISHVISNIISNAVKFSPNDAMIEVTVESASVDDKNPDGIAVSVRDRGVGIPEGEEAEIFETFVQSTKTYDGTGGTGLGLSISQEMVRLHHGRIFARNNEDMIGATFTFILPRHQLAQGVTKNAA